MKRIRAAFVVALCVSGCSRPAEQTPPADDAVTTQVNARQDPPPPQTARAPFETVLAALPTATVIRLTNGWFGLSPANPVAHRFELVRAGTTFNVHSVCRAAERELALPDQTVSFESVAPILDRLVGVPVGPGPYEPRIDHTDDYPQLVLELETPAGSVSLRSRSQGELADPWEVASGDSTGVVASPIPGRAFRDLLALVGSARCDAWTRTIEQGR